VVQGLTALFAGVDEEREVLLYPILAQQITQQARAQGVVRLVVGSLVGGDLAIGRVGHAADYTE
jgi:hypothetical protein